MKRTHQRQYTIRQVPSEVDRRIRDAARRSNLSLNQALLGMLTREAGVAETPSVYHDLDSFFGSWTADTQVDQVLADQRKVDKEMWR